MDKQEWLEVSLEAAKVTETFGEIKNVFETFGKDVKFDRKMVKRISKYVSNFVNRNEDSVNFFGDALIGVYPVKFTKEDKDIWFDEVLDIDEISIRRELHSLEAIDPTFRVSSDVTNQSYVWVVHKLHASSELSAKEKEESCIEVLSMMQYKFLTSIMTHYFPYAADKAVAVATYASLSKKFALKVHGSWAKMVRARSESILSKDSIHYRTYTKYSNDFDIVKMINDIQGRIREVVKSVSDVFYRVLENDAKIASTSSVVDIDGEKHVADKSNNYMDSRRYVHSVAVTERDFIKDVLIDIITKAVHTVSERHLREALKFIPDNYGGKGMKYLDDLLDKAVIHALNYLNDNDVAFNNLPEVLSKMRSIYMSSRGNEVLLVEVRELGDKVVASSVRSKNTAALAAVRTALLMYIVLRALTEKHFG